MSRSRASRDWRPVVDPAREMIVTVISEPETVTEDQNNFFLFRRLDINTSITIDADVVFSDERDFSAVYGIIISPSAVIGRFDVFPALDVLNNAVMTGHAVQYAVGILSAPDLYFTNTGTLDVLSNNQAYGVDARRHIEVFNSGTISAVSRATYDQEWNSPPNLGIALQAFGTGYIVNTGLISGSHFAIRIGWADPLWEFYYEEPGFIHNFGDIVGAIWTTFGRDTVFNDGTIQGDVRLNLGTDLFDGSGGVIAGRVLAGPGDDEVHLGDSPDATAFGGAGQDTLTGGRGSQSLYGELGDDWLDGGEGSDLLWGESGDDRLILLGEDVASGGLGSDTFELRDLAFASVDGGAGTDTLAIGDARIDLASFLTDNRIASIEVVHLEGGTVYLDAQSLLTADVTTLHVSGHGTLLLGGAWTATDADAQSRSYASGGVTLRVDESVDATVDAVPDGLAVAITLQDAPAPDAVSDKPLDMADGPRSLVLWESATIDPDSAYRFVNNALDSPSGHAVILLARDPGPDNEVAPTLTNRADHAVQSVQIAESVWFRDRGVDVSVISGVSWNVVNYGDLTMGGYKASGVGISLQGLFDEDLYLHNHGDITLVADGLFAVGINAVAHDVLNTGSIALLVPDDDIGNTTTGIAISGGQVIDNTGELSIHARYAIGIEANGYDTGSRVTNTGTIVVNSADADGVGIQVMQGQSRDMTIVNHGTIIADTAIAGTFDPFPVEEGYFVTVRNTGRMDGEVVLSGGDDVLTNTGDGVIIGTVDAGDGDDRLTGGNGRDVFVGNGGDDALFGEAALELASDSLEAQLFRAYQVVFDRAPDAAGFDVFLAAMRLGQEDQESVLAQFVASEEFEATYGALSNLGFVEQLYRNVLDREGDAAGVEAFTAALDGGRSRASVVLEFANAPEFVALMALPTAAFASNVWISPADFAVFRAYQAVFDRAPDAVGFRLFSDAVALGALSIEAVTAEFVASPEFQDTYGDLANRAFMELLYQNVFGRQGDEAGLNAFTAALDAGDLTRAEVVAEFVQSFEFVAQTQTAALAFVDTIFDETADDQLVGASGDDMLYGGRGDDVFNYEDGHDTVLDFSAGNDTLRFRSLGEDFDTFDEVMAVAEQVGQDVVFTFSDTQSLTLLNVMLDTITVDDVTF